MESAKETYETYPFKTRPGRMLLSVKSPNSWVIHEVIRLASHNPDGPDEREQLAVATVLLSIAGSDRKYRPVEIRETYNLLEKRFNLSLPEAHRYIERVALLFTVQGRKRLTRNALRFLKASKNKAHHLELFQMATKIARADGGIARGEIGWLKRFVRELSLTVCDCRKALHRTPYVA